MNLFKKLFQKHQTIENSVLPPYTNQFYEIHLSGNNRTGTQIKDWNSPHFSKMSNADGSRVKKGEIPNNGRGYAQTFFELLEGKELPNKLPEIGGFELYKSSKATDFISGSFLSQYGMILSGKTKQIMEQFNLGNHQFYPLSIELKGEIDPDYFFLRTVSDVEPYIEFSNSEWNIREFNPEVDTSAKLTPIKLLSKEDVESFKKENHQREDYLFRDIVAKHLKLTAEFPKWDLFVLEKYRPGFESKYLISERLRKALGDLSGVGFIATDYNFEIQ